MANDEPPARMPGYPPPPPDLPDPVSEEAQPAASRLSVNVSPRNVRLQPGEVVTASIKVRNMGPVVDEITLTPRRATGAWITVAPDTLNIFPNTQAEATIRFAPPRSSLPPAGPFNFEIAVNADRQPDSSMVYQGSVEIGAYDSLSASAIGTTYITGRRDATLPIKVVNLGNRPTNVQVSAAELAGATVALSAPTFALEPGAENTVRATIKPRSGFMSGPPRQFPFTIAITSDYSPRQTIDGRMEQLARFSRKRVIGAGVLAAVLLIFGGWFAAGMPGLPGPGPMASPTAIASGSPSPPASAVQTATPSSPTNSPPASSPPSEMAGWSKLPGDLEFDQGPAVSSWGPNHLDVFVPDQGGQLYHSAWDGQTWSPWEKVGDGTVAFKVAAISRHVNSVDVLAVRTDKKQMYRLTGENGSFGNWQLISPLGTQMTFSAGPGVSSWGEGELDAFARGGGRNLLQHASFDGVQWNEWQAWIDEPILMAPAAIGWIGNTAGDLAKHIEIFVLKASGQARKGPVLHLAYTDPTLPPSSVPLDLESDKAPAVASWAPSTRLDVFARGTSGTVLWTKLEGTQTTDWEPISQSVVNSAPAAVSWGEGRIDVFVLGSDNRVWHRAYDGTNWFEPPF